MRTVFALGLLLSATPVLAQSAFHYECKADSASGFSFNETSRSWQPTVFKVNGTYSLRPLSKQELNNGLNVEKEGRWGAFTDGHTSALLECDDPRPNERLSCGGTGMSFVMDTNSLRYQYYYQGTYVAGRDGNDDTPVIEIGRCKMKDGAR